MRFARNVAFGLFSIALMGFGNIAFADEIDDALGNDPTPSSSTSSSSTLAIEKPTFTPLAISAAFYEQFTDDWDSRWKVSHAKKELSDKSTEEEWAYVGQWAVEEPTILKGIEGDKGLVVKNVAAHHAISAKFDKPIDNTGKTLVLQYEVKLQNGLECGGAYMKLLKENADLHAEEFSNASPYVIMFGPDKCGATNKVHFIFKHKNPITGEYEEKHLGSPPMAKITKRTTLYTLIVNPDQTFDLRIDGKSVKNGSLLEDFVPAVNPPKEIDDPADSKPEDWVDTAQIPDPDAKKPDDWDEDAPMEIVDDEATKPADWLDDEPEFVPDPNAKKPDDWDDEEDGDYIPPTVNNPKCQDVSGCGPWERPLKPNPAYKGKWSAPMVDNPAYKGPWAPRRIPNPNHFDDSTPANFEPIGAIGYELWTMTKDILFDNIYVGHSVADAEKLQKATFDVKRAIEEKEEEATAPKAPEPLEPTGGSFKEDPVAFVRAKLVPFLRLVKLNPMEAVRAMPDVAGALATVIVTTLALLVGLISMATAPAKVAKPVAPAAAAASAKKESAQAEPAKADSNSSSSEGETAKPKATRRSSKKA